MKTRLVLLAALLASSMTIFNLSAEENNTETDDQSQDGDIEGHETLDAHIVLTATSNAPHGARGVADLQADNEEGAELAVLEVQTRGLIPGDYTVSAIRKSDGSAVVLDQITVGDPSDEGDQVGEDLDEQEDGEHHDADDGDGDGEQDDEAKFALPA